ncbi:MAG: hypothetical protein P8Z40_03310 [Chloroflexota bacterium]|jgi:hypothetical protein
MAHHNMRTRANTILGLALVALGGLFLVGQMFDISFWHFFWPFFIIGPGLMFFIGMVLIGESAGPLAIPGSIVTMVGLLLLYQSVFNHFESWAYAWALIFPTAVGVGLMINGVWSKSPRLVEVGTRWSTIGLAIFLVGGLFFELLLNISDNIISGIVWPGLLIVFGLYLLGRHRAKSRISAPPTSPPERLVEEASPAQPVPMEEAPKREEKTEFRPLDIPRQ